MYKYGRRDRLIIQEGKGRLVTKSSGEEGGESIQNQGGGNVKNSKLILNGGRVKREQWRGRKIKHLVVCKGLSGRQGRKHRNIGEKKTGSGHPLPGRRSTLAAPNESIWGGFKSGGG